MCNPALAFQAVTVAMTAYGAYSESKAEKESLNYEEAMQKNNAKVAENNRALADQQAEDTKQRGEVEAQNHLRQVAALKSSQKTKMAANGLALNEGSPLSLLEDTDFQGNYDADTMRSNAARDAWGSQVQGMNYQAQANDLKSSAALTATKAKQIKPGMSALTAGAGSVDSKWSSIKSGSQSAQSAYQNNTGTKKYWNWS